MKFLSTILISVALTAIFGSLDAQTTRDLFSRPGLALGAYHHNFYEGYRNVSYRFAGDTVACGDTLLVFEEIEYTYNKVVLKIQNGSVWKQSFPDLCAPGKLYYNFDLNVGQAFLMPNSSVFTVAEKSTKVLLNGETRRFLRLVQNGGPAGGVQWIEGIGDVVNGFLPEFGDFEGYGTFVCARDNSGDLWQNPAESASCDSLLCPRPITKFQSTVADKTATFENSSLNAVDWIWEFGDGETSTEFNPVHNYSGPGCYEVCLTSFTDCRQKGERICLPTPVCIDPAWEKIPATPWTQGIVDIDFISPGTGWMITGSSIWKTTDAGAHWVQQFLPFGPPDTYFQLFDIDMLDAQKGIIGAGNYQENGIEYSILFTKDGGATWEPRVGGSHYISDVLMTNDGKAFATGQFQELYFSADGGETWAQRDFPGVGDLVWMQYMGNDTLYAFGYQGLPPQHTPAFFKSYNSGLSWNKVLMPQYPVQHAAYFLNTQRGWAAGNTGFMLQTTDGGEHWNPYPFGESVKVSSIGFANEFSGWAVGEKGLVLHTTHGGLGWNRENCGYMGNMHALSAPAGVMAYVAGSGPEMLYYSPGLIPYCGLSTPVSTPETSNALEIKPNPAASWISIETGHESGHLAIYNALGQLCFSQACDTEMTFVNVSAFAPGMYTAVFLPNSGKSRIGSFLR